MYIHTHALYGSLPPRWTKQNLEVDHSFRVRSSVTDMDRSFRARSSVTDRDRSFRARSSVTDRDRSFRARSSVTDRDPVPSGLGPV